MAKSGQRAKSAAGPQDPPIWPVVAYQF